MQDLAVAPANLTPVADARVLGMTGSEVEIPYRGAPVSLTLDASESRDLDGRIVSYRWLSGVVAGGESAADGGTDASGGGRWVPRGEPENWPDDIEQPTVVLDQGKYTFVLWVVDDGGKVSAPSTLQVNVATALDPAVQACVDSAADNAPRECAACVCAAGDACRAAIAETACTSVCWSLLGCIADRCPTRDSGCIGTQCSSFLGGLSGVTAVGRCITESCATACTRD